MNVMIALLAVTCLFLFSVAFSMSTPQRVPASTERRRR